MSDKEPASATAYLPKGASIRVNAVRRQQTGRNKCVLMSAESQSIRHRLGLCFKPQHQPIFEPRFSIRPLPLRKKRRRRAVFRGIALPRFEWERYSDKCAFGELSGVVAPPSKMQLASSSRLASQSAKGTLVAASMENLG